jgi:hypothetical protein
MTAWRLGATHAAQTLCRYPTLADPVTGEASHHRRVPSLR